MQILLITLLIIIRIFSNSFTNVFQKQLTVVGESPSNINFYNYLLLTIISMPIILTTDFSFLNKEFCIYAILGGICGAVCNCFMVLALKNGQLSVLGPINSYKAVISLFFGIIILKEYPNIFGILGIILIILGTYFILDKPNDILKKEIRYRFYALFFSAIEAVFIKKVILLSNIQISFAATIFLGCIFSFAIAKFISKLQIPKRNSYVKYIATALCFGLMTLTTAIIFKFINVSYALSLFQLSIIVNVLLGWKLFKEENLLKKLAGSLIIITGSIIIILFGN